MQTSSGPRFDFEFVEYIPDKLEERTLYISIPFATAAHNCACGCGEEVVTPLSPTDWKLIFDGDSVSLDPSIGNWSLPCGSHYWLMRNQVLWAPKCSRSRIEAGREAQRAKRERHLNVAGKDDGAGVAPGCEKRPSSIQRLWDWLRRFISPRTR